MYGEKVIRVCKLTEFFPLSKVKINLYLNTFQALKVRLQHLWGSQEQGEGSAFCIP